MPERGSAEVRRYRLRLLGRWHLASDTGRVELGHREERLTALLGLSGRSSRLHVAGVLWPESTDARALASLRRAVLQTQERSPGLLQADRLTIGLDPDVDIDVDEVRRAAAATEDALVEGEAGALVRQLVGEELLPDWYDDWVLQERECLEQVRVKALERVARHALEVGDPALTVDAAHAAGDIDPLLESAGELAIRAHLDRGDLGSARREFDRYRDAMRDELGAPPSRAILDLIEPVLAAGSTGPREAGMVGDQRGVAPDVVVTAPVTALPPVPTTAAIPPRHEPARAAGARGAVVRLLGVAALVLAAALAVAGVGDQDGGDVGDSGGTTLSTMRVLRADGAIRAGQMVVRPVDAALGRAAFLVRTTLRPARVQLEMRGPAGAGVVRTLLVRSARGRVVELAGLDPGRYRWSATSPVASTVSGRLRIPGQPLSADAGGSLEAAGPASSDTGSTAPASPAPSPSRSTATAPPVPSQEPRHSAPASTTPEPRPTGRPIDPGAVPETPVG